MDRTVIRSRIVGVNVPTWERVASVALGGALIALGVRKKSLAGGLIGLAGVPLIVRGVTGRSGAYRMRAVRKGVVVRRSVTVQATAQEVYDLWRDLTNLPKFMQHVKSVQMEAGNISHWIVQEGPVKLEWRAEITEDSPGRRLRWRSLPGGDLQHDGLLDLREAPGGRGTIVEVKLRYMPPGGLVAAGMFSAALRKLPGLQLGEELARLQQLIETGEIATGARTRALDEKLGVGLKQAPPATTGVSP